MDTDNLSLHQHRAIALILKAEYTGLNNQDIAERLGISIRTLYRWQAKKNFNDELIKQSQKLMNEFLSTAYSELRKLISGTDVNDSHKIKAIRLYLESQGLLKSDRTTFITVKKEPTITFADMLAELEPR